MTLSDALSHFASKVKQLSLKLAAAAAKAARVGRSGRRQDSHIKAIFKHGLQLDRSDSQRPQP